MKTLQNLIILFLSSTALAQSEYVIDEFRNVNDYYVAFNNGSGSLTNSINTSDFQSGNESLQLDYSFSGNSSGHFLSALRNYGTQVQDYSFQALGFSIYFKGGSSSDSYKLRFWEDINSNGVFDGEDEVYESVVFAFNPSINWEYAEFSLTDFTLVAGAGNSKFDLNHIRAWDVAVTSSGGSAHSATLLVDRLALGTSYTPPTLGSAKLNGSFMQLWNTEGCKCGQWTQLQWNQELQKMKDLCMEKIVIQYGVYGDLSWYSPSSLGYVTYKESTLNKIMVAAESKGMKVVFGLYFDEGWNSADKTSGITYSSLLLKHKGVIDEIWNLFGSSTSFGGWYIPQEINDLEWQVDPQKSLLFDWLKDVSDYAKTKSSVAPVIIAPFNNLWQSADDLATWYDELLTVASNLDGIYPQDGVGITLKDVNYHVPLYYDAIARVCNNHGVEFNATTESFQQLTGWPIDGGAFSATSAAIDRLKKQMWVAEDMGAVELIQFEWAYMQEDLNPASTILFNDYTAYAPCTITAIDLEESNGMMFWPNPAHNILHYTGKNISLYNTQGDLLLENGGDCSLDISILQSGLYFLNIDGRLGKLVVE